MNEFLTALRHTPQLRRIAALQADGVYADASITVLPQTRQRFEDGFALYKSRPDKAYSLTDCISMNTMRQEGFSEILTHDAHFTQEGFTILL
jgi:uncharacterized protein